jgi:hypothetical protein
VKSVAQKLTAALAVLVLCGLGLVGSAAAAKGQTFTGEVSDSMCGAKHAMAGDNAACTRACVKKGSNYALVVGDKVYTLKTEDKAALSELDKLAGAQAKVSGTADGDTIAVSKVSAAK